MQKAPGCRIAVGRFSLSKKVDSAREAGVLFSGFN